MCPWSRFSTAVLPNVAGGFSASQPYLRNLSRAASPIGVGPCYLAQQRSRSRPNAFGRIRSSQQLLRPTLPSSAYSQAIQKDAHRLHLRNVPASFPFRNIVGTLAQMVRLPDALAESRLRPKRFCASLVAANAWATVAANGPTRQRRQSLSCTRCLRADVPAKRTEARIAVRSALHVPCRKRFPSRNSVLCAPSFTFCNR